MLDSGLQACQASSCRYRGNCLSLESRRKFPFRKDARLPASAGVSWHVARRVSVGWSSTHVHPVERDRRLRGVDDRPRPIWGSLERKPSWQILETVGAPPSTAMRAEEEIL